MSITLEQYHDKITRLMEGVPTLKDEMLELPANNLIGNIDFRITQEGIDSSGGKIGDYSKKKSWATASAFDNKGNFKPNQRKNGKGRRRSVDLEDGYFELRALQGYRNDRVVLERTGAGIKNIKSAVDENTAVIGFTDENEAVKFRGYEDRNDNQVLAPTRGELDQVAKEQVEAFRDYIKKTFA